MAVVEAWQVILSRNWRRDARKIVAVWSAKEAESAAVKFGAITLAILAALLASIALADDFKTINGKEYKNVEIRRVEPDGLVLWSKSGILKVYFNDLPKDVVDKWLPPQEKERIAAEKAAEEKRIQEQQAAERERARKEHEREEKETNADADLKRAEEQFRVAEERATQRYRSAAKGMLSGQIFISTRGDENFKLGAVQVSLFERNAVDAFIAAEKIHAGPQD